jgi:hypothetical protein
VDNVALHLFIPVYLKAGLTRFARKFNVLQNKLLTHTADNGRVRGIKNESCEPVWRLPWWRQHTAEAQFCAGLIRSPPWKEGHAVQSVHTFLSLLILLFFIWTQHRALSFVLRLPSYFILIERFRCFNFYFFAKDCIELEINCNYFTLQISVTLAATLIMRTELELGTCWRWPNHYRCTALNQN